MYNNMGKSAITNENDAITAAKSENTLVVTTKLDPGHVITYTPEGKYNNVGGSHGNSIQTYLWMGEDESVKFFKFEEVDK
jgi:hypothetical protein